MNLRTQNLAINPDSPFEFDPFKREPFSKSLSNIILKSDGLTMMIDSPWGHGKTTFIEQWKASLTNKSIVVFDAHRHDSKNTPFVDIACAISNEINSKLTSDQPASSTLKKVNTLMVKALKSTAIKQGKKYVGDLIDQIEDEGLEGAVHDVVDSASNAFDEFLKQEKKIKDELLELKTAITASAKEYQKTNNGFPLTIVIDELDRCRPDYALSLLENIKYLFDADGVCFIIFCDRDRLAKHISPSNETICDYGYLSKFADITLSLPEASTSENNNVEYYQQLLSIWNKHMKAELPDPAIKSLSHLCWLNQLSMRDSISTLKITAVCYEPHLSEYPEIILLCCSSFLTVHAPNLPSSQISKSQILKKLNIDPGTINHNGRIILDAVKKAFPAGQSAPFFQSIFTKVSNLRIIQ